MIPILSVLLFIIGLAALLKGADFFTENSADIARSIGVSELVIGLTLVAFATSLPELGVSLTASFFGASGIALGNVIGSNIANIGLVIGLSAIFAPLTVYKRDFNEGAVMFLLLLAGSLFILEGLQRWEGLLLLIFLFAYVIEMTMRRKKKIFGKRSKKILHKEIILCIIGAAGVIIGSRLAVDSAVVLAEWAGISKIVIGMTIIAIGTSLPELATSAVAALKGLRELALGNIIGSNIFNMAAILGASSLVRAIPITEHVALVDLPIMLIFASLLLFFMRRGWKISRLDGSILLAGYIGFLVLQFV